MAEQFGDGKALERDRDPMDEDVIGRSTEDEEFEESDEAIDEEDADEDADKM